MSHQDWSDLVIRKPKTVTVATARTASSSGSIAKKTYGLNLAKFESPDAILPPTIPKSVSDNIKELRLKKGFTQATLGKALSLGEKIIKSYEDGKALHDQTSKTNINRITQFLKSRPDPSKKKDVDSDSKSTSFADGSGVF